MERAAWQSEDATEPGSGLGRWYRYVDGFVWNDSVELLGRPRTYYEAIEEQDWLMPRGGTSTPRETLKSLLEAPMLWRDFARLGETVNEAAFEPEVIEFAGKYGFLGRPSTVLAPGHISGADDTVMTLAEPLSLWRAEAYNVARLAWLWKKIRGHEKHPERLKQHVSKVPEGALKGAWRIKYEPKAPAPYFRRRRGQETAMKHFYPIGNIHLQDLSIADFLFAIPYPIDPELAPPPDLPEEDVLGRARAILAEELNDELLEHRGAVQLYKRTQSPEYGLRQQSQTLIGMIYSALVHEFVGVHKAAHCKVCNRWFVAERSTAVYCSNRCRVRAKRSRDAEKARGK